MYYCFLHDELFYNKTIIAVADAPYPVCILDRTVGNYFHEKIMVTDPRDERVAHFNKHVNGKLRLFFDGSKHDTNHLFKRLSSEQIATMFAMLETISLANGESEKDLDRELATAAAYKNIYVEGSLKLSKRILAAVIPKIDSTTEKTEISVVSHFDIEFHYAGELEPTKFRIYLSRQEFLDNYPLSTINAVGLPADHKYILNPSLSTGVIDMMIKSTEFSFGELESSVITEDHSGIFTYFTKYVTSDPAATQLLPFGIMYQGAKPTSLEIRKAIRDKLLGYGTADKAVWEQILPDLFVTAQFYIAPMWNNYTMRIEGVTYPSIIDVKMLTSTMGEVFPNLDEKYVQQYQELLTYGHKEIFLVSIPDPLNESKFSIKEIHPTYQYHAHSDSAFDNMDVHTREFNGRLNAAMAVAYGETPADNNTVINKIDDRTWFAFVSGGVEYLILSKEDYQIIFPDPQAKK